MQMMYNIPQVLSKCLNGFFREQANVVYDNE